MISFVIITDGKEIPKLDRELKSIRDLHIPFHEIIIVGKLPFDYLISTGDTRYMETAMAAETGHLGFMRNEGCGKANGDILVVADDDIVFHDDFYTGILWHEGKFDVLACRLLNPDGTRFWDWSTYKGPNGHALLDYEKTDYQNQYISGGLITMKRYVWDECKWDNGKGFYQNEDIDFSEKLKEHKFHITFNPFSTATHDAGYTQEGRGIVRTKEGWK